MRGLSLVAASRGYSLLWCVGFSLRWLLLLWSTGSRCVGFSSCGLWALEHRLRSCGPRTCSETCGIIPDQDSNPCPLHWQADSQPLRHQGSPQVILSFTSLGSSAVEHSQDSLLARTRKALSGASVSLPAN